MEVSIRFLSFCAKVPRGYSAFPLPDGATGEDLLRAVDVAGKAGMFCLADDWPGIQEHVLLASDARMLQTNESLHDGQSISIIGLMIGG